MDWTDAEIMTLRDRVNANVPLGEIARELSRPYAQVAMQATKAGVNAVQRRRKIPRGKGYDKATMRKHVVALWRYQGTIPQYARANSLQPDPFVASFKQHFPDAWVDYVRERGEPERRDCTGCGGSFYPSNGNQFFCSTKCASDKRRDDDYFGGERLNTVGLAAGVCQLCGGTPQKGLSSHHALGKQDDPDNLVLIALCRGCHRLVTDLSQRKFVDNPAAWEALIALVWLRRHGDEQAQDVHIGVDIAERVAA